MDLQPIIDLCQTLNECIGIVRHEWNNLCILAFFGAILALYFVNNICNAISKIADALEKIAEK